MKKNNLLLFAKIFAGLFFAVFYFISNSNFCFAQAVSCSNPLPAGGVECSVNPGDWSTECDGFTGKIRSYCYYCSSSSTYPEGEWVKHESSWAYCDATNIQCKHVCREGSTVGTASCVADTSIAGCHFGCVINGNYSGAYAECLWMLGAPDPNDPLRCTAETPGSKSNECYRWGCTSNNSVSPFDPNLKFPAACELVPKTNTSALYCGTNRDCVYTNCSSMNCIFSSKSTVTDRNQCKYGSQDAPSANLQDCYKFVCRDKKCTKVANSKVSSTDVACSSNQEGQELDICKKPMCGTGLDSKKCIYVAVEDKTLTIPCTKEAGTGQASRDCQFTRCVSSGGDSNNAPTCELATKTSILDRDQCKYGDANDPSAGLFDCYVMVCRDMKCVKISRDKLDPLKDTLCPNNSNEGDTPNVCKKSMCGGESKREMCIYVPVEDTKLTISCTDNAGANTKSRDCQVTKCESTECKLTPKTSATERDQCKYGTDSRSANLPKCYHLECKGNVCEKTVGQSTDTCTVDSNSKPSGDCQYIACESASTSNCVLRTGTRINNIEDAGCTVTGTAGGNFTCANTADGTAVDYTRCVNKTPGNICKHLACGITYPYSCQYVSGKGDPQCTVNPNSCVHSICQVKTCTQVPVTQQGTICSGNPDCHRTVCDGMACVDKAISEIKTTDVSCSADSGGNPSGECQYIDCTNGPNSACSINPKTSSQQADNRDCVVIGTPGDGLTCANNASGTGFDWNRCVNRNSEVNGIPVCKHLDCGGNALKTQCTYVNGKGANLCSSVDHPDPNLPRCSHLGCDINNRCTYLPGGGSDSCSSEEYPNANLLPCTHKDCDDDGECVDKPGQGADLCGPNSNPTRICCNTQSECTPQPAEPTGGIRCSSIGVEEEYRFGACDADRGGCVERTDWILVKDCHTSICVETQSCSGTKAVATRVCNICKDNSCVPNTTKTETECGPPSTSTAGWCTTGATKIQCTLTAIYSGKCKTVNATSAKCEDPTVELICEGPCIDTDGDGIPDSEDPDDDNDGIPDEQDPDPKNPNIPVKPPVPPEPPCTQTCPDGTIIDCDEDCSDPDEPCVKICPDGSKTDCESVCPPGEPPCIETCSDGSTVICGADCPACYKSCLDGNIVDCDTECPNPPEPPGEPPGVPPDEPYKNYCTKDKKCSLYGTTGIECLADEDCEYSCDKAYKCAFGGGGAICSKDTDCLIEKPKCVFEDDKKICRPDSCGGEDCSVDQDCGDLPTFCDDTCGKCVPGGDTGIPCDNDAICEYGCNEDLQCVFGGVGGACNVYKVDDCENKTLRCNDSWQCVADDCGGIECTEDEDCDLPPTCDSKCEKCVPGGDTGIECFSDEECRILDTPPTVENMKTVNAHCTGTSAGAIYFQWEYKDLEKDPEVYFRLEIDDNSDFSSPTITREVFYPSSTFNQQLVSIKTTNQSGYLKYGTTYYWRVKVREGLGTLTRDSDWYRGPSYTNTGHPDPIVIYTANPNPTTIGRTVTFTDASICYNNKGESYACQDTKNQGYYNYYTWTYTDGVSTETQEKNTSQKDGVWGSYIYIGSKKAFASSLQICDGGSGICCTAGLTVSVNPDEGNDLPKWKEITPFQ